MSEAPLARPTVAAETLEKLVVRGDLKDLTSAERLMYYRTLCDSIGLNPLSRPFEYLTLSGRLTLYARKDATDQLRELHNVSVTKVDHALVDGIYCVTAYAVNGKGRTDAALGAVSIEGLKGEPKANAMMKSECVPLDSEILTWRGFMRYDALTIGESVLAYDPASDECVWTPLLNVTTYDALPMVRLFTPRRFAVRCTPDHSWAVTKPAYKPHARGRGPRGPRGPYRSRTADRFLVDASAINTSHRLIMAAPERKAVGSLLGPVDAAVLGWAVTDGTIQRRGAFVRVGVCQSKAEYFEAIRALMTTLAPGIKEIVTTTASRTFPMTGKTYATLPQHWWYLPSAVGRDLLQRAGFTTRADLPRIAAALNGESRRAMLTAFMQAEGDKRDVFANGDPHILEAFQILAALEGFSTGRLTPKPPIWTQRLMRLRHMAGSNLRSEPIAAAPAWCPTTAYGTWVMRQDGKVTITGNTKAKRRVTLSLCGLGILDETEVETIPGARVGEMPAETLDQETARLFPTPAEEDARALLGRIEAGFAKLKLDEPSRRGAWSTHCGTAPYLSHDTDVAALGALLADLLARAKAR